MVQPKIPPGVMAAMDENNAISMLPVKYKLANLERVISGQPPLFYHLAQALARDLNDELLPAGFLNAGLGLVLALEQGERRCLTSYPELRTLVNPDVPNFMYRKLIDLLPEIAKAACPEPFASQVRGFYNVTIATKRESPPKA